jgi:tetratricopeptide (TPR) repeat protein
MAARVFISYAHESKALGERVAAFARQLRNEGIDAWIDQFVEDDPPYWPTWMIDQVDQADFVLCVVTEAYRARFEAQTPLSQGRGVNWEGLVITEQAYTNMPSAHRRFIVVVFDPEDLAYVPRPLLGAGRTAYVLPGSYQQLYRRLSGQARQVPPLGEIRPLADTPEPIQGTVVHSRPAYVTTRFLNRERESRTLRAEVERGDNGCVVLCGKPGVGKTALVGRLLEFLEGQALTSRLDFFYLTMSGTVPVTPDLIRSHVFGPSASSPLGPSDVGEDTREPTRRALVIDAAELLLDTTGDWCSPALGIFLCELARRPRFKLVLVCRRSPSRVALSGTRRVDLVVAGGLPPAEARALLLHADGDGQLGLRESPDAVEEFVRKADGNPRALELVAAALNEDPLLTPAALAADMALAPDIAEQLLGDSYRSLSSGDREIVALLAVASSAMPLSIAREATGVAGFDDRIRDLTARKVVKVDRVGQRVLIDAFDADYAQRTTVTAQARQSLHGAIAAAAILSIERGDIRGSEANTWAIGAIMHLIAAGRLGDAATALDTLQRERLEPHGLYDQLIRLREGLLTSTSGADRNQIALVRLLYLTGRLEDGREMVRRADPLFEAICDPELTAAWHVETGLLLTDLDESREAMRRYRRAVRRQASPQGIARALSGAAQIARRRGHLAISEHWLERALDLVAGAPFDATTQQVEALTLHQLAQIARFRGRPAEALRLLVRAEAVSKQSEDRGGSAYRACLQAALDSDTFEMDDAASALEMALVTYDEIGDHWGTSSAALALAAIQADRGHYDAATAHLTTAARRASESHNTRVRGLAHSVRLTIERRAGTLAPETRALAQRAHRFLAEHGYQLYAQRAATEIELHDLVTNRGASPSAAGRTIDESDPITAVLPLARPLAAFLPPPTRLPAGIARDVALWQTREP